MLLTGTFFRSLDDKSRVGIPKPFRDAWAALGGRGMYLAPGTDGSLALYDEQTFADLGHQLAHNSPTGRDVRAFSRLFYAQAQFVEVDRQGRLRIPSELASFARLEKEVVLLGVRDHLEIWNRLQWEAYLTEEQAHYDEIAEKAFQPPSGPQFGEPAPREASLPARPR